MDIEKLRILQAIDQYGSINAASEKLFMAKSAISTSIKQSELEFGFKLLDRRGYRAKLSPKAKMYLEKAQKILLDFQELEGFRKLLSEDVESSIKISSTILYQLDSFIDLLKQVNKKFPETTIYSEREVLSGEKFLLNEDVDLAITESIIDKTNLEYKKVTKVNMPLVISSRHPFMRCGQKDKSIENLLNYPQIVLRSTLPESTGMGGVYKNAVKWKVSDDYTKLELIRKGLGWGRLPYFLIEKEIQKGTFSILDNIEKTLKIDIYLCRRKNYQYGKVANYIWDLL